MLLYDILSSKVFDAESRIIHSKESVTLSTLWSFCVTHGQVSTSTISRHWQTMCYMYITSSHLNKHTWIPNQPTSKAEHTGGTINVVSFQTNIQYFQKLEQHFIAHNYYLQL